MVTVMVIALDVMPFFDVVCLIGWYSSMVDLLHSTRRRLLFPDRTPLDNSPRSYFSFFLSSLRPPTLNFSISHHTPLYRSIAPPFPLTLSVHPSLTPPTPYIPCSKHINHSQTTRSHSEPRSSQNTPSSSPLLPSDLGFLKIR